jgi:LysM repeat protein
VRNVRYSLGLLLLLLLIGGCTRNRAAPAEATATATPLSATVQDTAVVEPQVATETPLPVPAAAEDETAAPEATPTAASPASQQRFQYTVQDGDSISSIAAKFETSIETIQRLNFLIDEKIFVGQVLEIPFREGMTAAGAPTPTPEPFRYTVERGDTLGSIAAKFEVTTIALIEANNLTDPNSVFVGQALLIPGYQPADAGNSAAAPTDAGEADPAASSGAAGVTHIVQPGESLLIIAQKYGVEASVIAATNGIANPNQLRVGQKLTIPGVSEQEAARLRGQVHVVQAGESLLSIAVQYGVTTEELSALNNISNPDAIFVGQELVIPTQQ